MVRICAGHASVRGGRGGLSRRQHAWGPQRRGGGGELRACMLWSPAVRRLAPDSSSGCGGWFVVFCNDASVLYASDPVIGKNMHVHR